MGLINRGRMMMNKRAMWIIIMIMIFPVWMFAVIKLFRWQKSEDLVLPPAPPKLVKAGNITVANGAIIDIWEYKTEGISCVIPIAVHPQWDSAKNFSVVSLSCAQQN